MYLATSGWDIPKRDLGLHPIYPDFPESVQARLWMGIEVVSCLVEVSPHMNE